MVLGSFLPPKRKLPSNFKMLQATLKLIFPNKICVHDCLIVVWSMMCKIVMIVMCFSVCVSVFVWGCVFLLSVFLWVCACLCRSEVWCAKLLRLLCVFLCVCLCEGVCSCWVFFCEYALVYAKCASAKIVCVCVYVCAR